MIYDITLKIGYEYPSAVKDARHILRVRPRTEPGQRAMSTDVAIAPRTSETVAERDFFGNALDHVSILPAHDELDVVMKAKVSVGRGVLNIAETPSCGEIAAVARAAREASANAPMHYLGASRLVRPSAALTAYAADSIDPGASAGEAVLGFARRIQAEFKYAPGATKVDTPLETAFKGREGVCQDFAHIMIAALRGVGVPAAYVSGFIRTEPPPGKPRLAGADAMHAWVNVWLGAKLGWRGFDPTNGILAMNDHIVVAVGRDYSDVAPIDGVMMTAGSQKTTHTVDVIPAPQMASSGAMA